MVAAARPQVSVYSVKDGKTVSKTLPLPDVFLSPIRPDLVNIVHSHQSLNARQAYAVNQKAGMDTAAESWGTGRAVSRIPRVPGGGTHRAGQGAFGNMCRGGRMFAPTKIWRKWHKKTSKKERKYATISALAASAVPALVMARGHRVQDVPEFPLVIDVPEMTKTKEAMAAITALGLKAEVEAVKESKTIRAGKAKARNKKYTKKTGPLFVYAEGEKVEQAFRGLAGFECVTVDKLNVVNTAPGGHLGRLIIWTAAAFEGLNAFFGTREDPSQYVLPRTCMLNADLERIVSSDEVKKAEKVVDSLPIVSKPKGNPYNNPAVMAKLNPYSEVTRKMAQTGRTAEGLKASKASRAANLKLKRAARSRKDKRDFYEKMIQ